MEHQEIRKKIIEACLWLKEMQFIIGTWGNVSVRCKEGFLLTPSRVSYDEMKPEDIVLIDLDGNKLSGDRTPSSEKEVHRYIYKKRNDVGAIVHGHSTFALAAAAAGQDIPPITEEMTQLIGDGIRCTKEYIRAGEHQKLGVSAANYIFDNNAVLLKNHGPVCCGKDLDEALLTCQVTEKSAQIFLHVLAAKAMDLQIIPKEDVKLENYRYHNLYGKE